MSQLRRQVMEKKYTEKGVSQKEMNVKLSRFERMQQPVVWSYFSEPPSGLIHDSPLHRSAVYPVM
jgi:hypothetical protein